MQTQVYPNQEDKVGKLDKVINMDITNLIARYLNLESLACSEAWASIECNKIHEQLFDAFFGIREDADDAAFVRDIFARARVLKALGVEWTASLDEDGRSCNFVVAWPENVSASKWLFREELRPWTLYWGQRNTLFTGLVFESDGVIIGSDYGTRCGNHLLGVTTKKGWAESVRALGLVPIVWVNGSCHEYFLKAGAIIPAYLRLAQKAQEEGWLQIG